MLKDVLQYLAPTRQPAEILESLRGLIEERLPGKVPVGVHITEDGLHRVLLEDRDDLTDRLRFESVASAAQYATNVGADAVWVNEFGLVIQDDTERLLPTCVAALFRFRKTFSLDQRALLDHLGEYRQYITNGDMVGQLERLVVENSSTKTASEDTLAVAVTTPQEFPIVLFANGPLFEPVHEVAEESDFTLEIHYLIKTQRYEIRRPAKELRAESLQLITALQTTVAEHYTGKVYRGTVKRGTDWAE